VAQDRNQWRVLVGNEPSDSIKNEEFLDQLSRTIIVQCRRVGVSVVLHNF
jgi:hypothetical protein